MADNLFTQVTQYCDCVKEITVKDVDDMISVVSLATGWMLNPCETFEKAGRREVITLPSCLDCPFEFEPYYVPFDASSFSFTLVERKGLEVVQTPIENFVYYGYDDRDMKYTGKMLVETGLPQCNCACTDECGCPTTYELVAEYEAGYETLPDCLLPVMCNLLEVIHAKNDCDCKQCGCEDGETITYDSDGNITSDQVIQYKSGDVVSVFLETDLAKMLVEQYKNQLGMMSLLKYTHNVWGYVV